MRFPKAFLLDKLDDYIENTIIDHRRWSIDHRLVFAHEDKFYSVEYSTGSTEYQDKSPWQYEDDVMCTEVHKIEKVVTVYE